MNDSQFHFFSYRRLPLRLTAQQVALMLNCHEEAIPALVMAKLLNPLGKPPANGVKFFCTEFILERCKDVKWLGRMTNVIHEYHRRKNAAKRTQPPHRNGSRPSSDVPGARED